MARNGSGTQTTPNTFVSGNSITASGHNQNWSDVASEITNSVAADGQTSMTGPLKLANGSAAAPSVTFASDQDSGWYRKAANSIALSLDGMDRIVYSTAAASFACEFIASATATFVLTANFTVKPVVPAKSFAISKIADGTANRLYGTDGSGVATEVALGNGLTLSSSALAATSILPRGYIDGCILANGADTTNDITFTGGVCCDSTGAFNITVPAFSTGKQLDANWAAGDAAGMRNSAAGITNTTYHIWAARTAASVTADIYAHTSAVAATVLTALQAETGGSSYAYLRLIGSIVRAGNTILQFVQDGDEFNLKTAVLDISNPNSGSTANTGTLASCPTGVRVRARVNAITAAAGDIYVSALDQTDMAPSATVAPLVSQYDSSNATAAWHKVRLNTSAQFRYRALSDKDVRFATLGWEHPRGKDA